MEVIKMFMEPEITEKQTWNLVEECGEYYYIESQYVTPSMTVTETIQGYGARLTAPGYLDCTDWEICDSVDEAREYLADTYDLCPNCLGELDSDYECPDCDSEKKTLMELHTTPPDDEGRHPNYCHLVMAEFEPNYGSYIMTLQGYEGAALLSHDDLETFDSFIRENLFGYVSDEYATLLGENLWQCLG